MLWVAVCACVLAALWCINWLIYNSEGMEHYSKIPGPSPLPVIGNSLDMVTDREGNIVSPVKLFYLGRKWATEYKDLYKFFMPPFKVLNLYNPEDIETVLSTPKFNEKSMAYSMLVPWLGNGLLLSNGVKWHTRRKILTPAFHFNILRHFSQILEENSWNMVNNLKTSPEQEKINIVPLISGYTLHSICETAMGTKLDEEETGAGLNYKNAIHNIGRLFVQRFSRAWLFNDLIFSLSSTGREQKKVLKTLKSFPKHVIDERRKYHEKFGDDMYVLDTQKEDEIHMTKKKKMAMLDLLLTAEKQGLIDTDGIQEEVDTFMFEGHDTTAMGLVFTLMLLANHKEAQDRIVEECRGIFGETDRPASMSDLQEMKYLECCVKEGLRLYPPVPFISRCIGEDVQLKNYMVPAGTICNVHIYDLHRRADLFEEPLQFRPERFSTDRRGDSRHPYAYIPFSAGPRNCIGQKFALLEMKSAISVILRTFELQPVTKPDDVVFTADLVLRPNIPIYINFVKRNK